jgi:DnaJ like chaperone protein
MPQFDKWLGAGLGWMVMGHPLGAVAGLALGDAMGTADKGYSHTAHTSDFESSLLVLASAVVKASGSRGEAEVGYIRHFFASHITSAYWLEKEAILRHCITKTYDLKKACTTLRLAGSQRTRQQTLEFLFEVAAADKEVIDQEYSLLFTLAGWLNVNDIQYKKIKQQYAPSTEQAYYAILGIDSRATDEQIKAAYRKKVLEYHPDRYPDLPVAARIQKETMFRKIQEAYNKIKLAKGF